MKTQKKTLKNKKSKASAPVEKILERMNALQNVTRACMEFGLESQQFYALLAKEGQTLERVYTLVPLEPHEKLQEIKDRKYHLTADIQEIIATLNETQNMELTCTKLGISALGITGLLRRNGVKIDRRYVPRLYTQEELTAIEEKKEYRKTVLLEKKKQKEARK